MKGTVKWYNDMKGFGFIANEDGNEVFVHRTSIPIGTDLYEGDRVEYEIEDSDRGRRAANVKRLKKA